MPVTCKECIHWDDGECHGIDKDWNHRNTIEGTEANIFIEFLDDQGLDVTLETGPDFFCALGKRE